MLFCSRSSSLCFLFFFFFLLLLPLSLLLFLLLICLSLSLSPGLLLLLCNPPLSLSGLCLSGLAGLSVLLLESLSASRSRRLVLLELASHLIALPGAFVLLLLFALQPLLAFLSALSLACPAALELLVLEPPELFFEVLRLLLLLTPALFRAVRIFFFTPCVLISTFLFPLLAFALPLEALTFPVLSNVLLCLAGAFCEGRELLLPAGVLVLALLAAAGLAFRALTLLALLIVAPAGLVIGLLLAFCKNGFINSTAALFELGNGGKQGLPVPRRHDAHGVEVRVCDQHQGVRVEEALLLKHRKVPPQAPLAQPLRQLPRLLRPRHRRM